MSSFGTAVSFKVEVAVAGLQLILCRDLDCCDELFLKRLGYIGTGRYYMSWIKRTAI